MIEMKKGLTSLFLFILNKLLTNKDRQCIICTKDA